MTKLAVALTWDGARWPAARLSPEARGFLGPVTSPKQVSIKMAIGNFDELRICWVPQLKGGTEVLCTPFATPNDKRIALHAVRQKAFGNVLGVVYRRDNGKA